MTLVVMTGATASGKSTAAEWLNQKLPPSAVFHSAEIREELGLQPEEVDEDYSFDLSDDVFVEHISTQVYTEMRSRARRAINHGKIAILDGSHRLRTQRDAAYGLGTELDVSVVVVYCKCSDEDAVRQRLKDRLDSDDPLSEATDYETYKSTIEDGDPVHEDLAVIEQEVSLIEYDSVNQSVNILIENSKDATVIADSLRELAAGYEGSENLA